MGVGQELDRKTFFFFFLVNLRPTVYHKSNFNLLIVDAKMLSFKRSEYLSCVNSRQLDLTRCDSVQIATSNY